MTELTTDQRTALALITTLQATAAVKSTMDAVAAVDSAVGKLAQHSADIQNDVGGRLDELAEALAEGTVRIVDEGALVHQVAQLMAADGEDWEKHVGSAQNLVLKIWKSTGVLR